MFCPKLHCWVLGQTTITTVSEWESEWAGEWVSEGESEWMSDWVSERQTSA